LAATRTPRQRANNGPVKGDLPFTGPALPACRTCVSAGLSI